MGCVGVSKNYVKWHWKVEQCRTVPLIGYILGFSPHMQPARTSGFSGSSFQFHPPRKTVKNRCVIGISVNALHLIRQILPHRDQAATLQTSRLKVTRFFLLYQISFSLLIALVADASLPSIECFHSRGQDICKFILTKERVCMRKEFNSQGTGLGHQHGRRFIVLGH